MRTGSTRIFIITSFLLLSETIFAQAEKTADRGVFTIILMAIVVIIAFAVILQVANSLMAVEAKKSGIDPEMAGFSIFPSVNELVSPGKRGFSGGEKVTVLKKGFDIKLEGAAPGNIDGSASANTFAMQPPNFRGIAPIPKVVVEIGDNVKAGDHLFFNKKTPDVKYVAPVSGEVVAINRGDRRSITEIVILADKQQQYRQLPAFDLGKSSREELANYLFDTGGWTLLRSRPFDTVAGMHDVPRDIFISTFDTAPLAPNLDIVVEGQGEAFQKGLDVLAKLTPGQVHLGLNAGGKKAPSPVFAEAKNVQKHWFSGKHPAGNVGIQIHHIAPITPSCTVWTLGVQEVIVLGKIFTEGRWNTERVVALTGAELDEPKYVRTLAGANVGELLKGNLSGDNVRLISGDVLSGQKKSAANFLNFFDDQLTVIEEGNYYEMFGWLLPSKPVPTVSKSIPSAALFPNTLYKGDTNMHGEKRAFVMTGEYESVLPMDIYPQHLMKAVLTNDYEKMEGLGIHELVEEDIALCEFVCTSKQPLQKILRTGLDMMNEQG